MEWPCSEQGKAKLGEENGALKSTVYGGFSLYRSCGYRGGGGGYLDSWQW